MDSDPMRLAALLQSPDPAPTGGPMDIFTGFQEYVGQTGPWLKYALAAAALLAVTAVLWGLVIRPQLERRRRLEELFEELARVNALSPGEESFLRGAARHHNLQNPAVVFVARARVEAYRGQGGRAGRLSDGEYRGLVDRLYS